MAKIAAVLGRPLMPWQRLVVDVALEVQSEAAGDPEPGAWAYNDVTLTVQRQAGKTTLLRPVVAHRCGSGRGRRVFGTAQKREKARKRWMDATDDFLTSPLRAEVRRKTARMGEELRWVRTQSTFEPFAPGGDADDMHGETPDLVLVDELWAFEHEQARKIQAAYVPGFLTKDAQAWKFSTAGTELSWWLNTARRSGRKAVRDGATLGTAYFEWSLPDRVPEFGNRRIRQLSDDELIQACIDYHPASGHTLRPAAVRLAWEQMGGDRSEFLRAYGNRSAEDLTTKWQAIEEAHWLAHMDGSSIPTAARVALGVWVDEDADDASVSAGWRDGAGVMHTEHLRRDDGIRWLSGWLAEKAERNHALVAVPNVGSARDVADELERAGVEVLTVSQADVTAACSRHRTAIEDGSWKSATSTEATAAAEAATLRGQRWDRPGASISALGSQTLAGWGIDHAPAPKRKRKLVIR